MRVVVPVLALTATLAFVAAGCRSSSPSAQEKWADSVCTNVGNWKSQVQKSVSDIQTTLKSPSSGMLTSIKADIRDAVTATQQLASNLKGLKPPDSGSGVQAQQQLNSLSTQLQTTSTQAKQAVASVPQGAGTSATLKALAPLAPSLQSLATTTQNTLNSIQASAKNLKEGFQKADSCKQFRS